jgi:transcriptional regulator with XRE-family HTH domain
MSSFGKLVREARRARGWTQQELAQRIRVSQRAVSAWELAVSEPDDDVKRAVAAALGLPPDAAGAAPASRPAVGRRYPGRAALDELPLQTLGFREFEDFAASLLGALYPGARQPYLLGGPGHEQGGFDVVVERDDGRVIAAVQCKRAERFGPAEVRKAVAAATMVADERYVFLSKVASPAAHAVMREHAGWQLWDRQRLSHAVRDLPLGAAARIVDRYFPGLRHGFLGLLGPGPWLYPEEYFGRIARSDHYSHRWRLVGRDGVLEDLVAFGAGERGRVAVLAGRGGAGKTKLVHDLCERLAGDRDLAVVFLDRDPDIDARSFELLPAGRLLVVVDDAHDDAVPVAKVVRGVYRANPEASVLLALRPYGEPQARLGLRDAGVPATEVFRCELDDLEVADAEALAREVLGNGPAAVAERLAHAARDCPLLLVASADLIRRGKLSPARLEGDAGMSRDLTEVLAGAVIDDMARQPEARIEVLHAIAALQPARTAEAEFRDALAALAGRPYDQVAPHIAALEEAGLLLRRGETFRVVPDLLGDWLLARRSRGPGGGSPTGYVDRVRGAARGPALANLIVNAGRVDWQQGPVAGLLDGLWREVRARLQAGDAEERLAVFGVLADVAFFQPRPCLDMVRWALDHPPGALAAGLGLPPRLAAEATTDAACRVLRGAAHDPAHLAEAADLLWQLGRDDPREPGEHQDHAMRILWELAAFRPAGPTTLQHALLGAVRRWLSLPAADGGRDPLEVLQPMLATEGRQELWNPRAASWRAFIVDPRAEPVTALRAAVIDVALGQLGSPDPRRVLAAFSLLGAALSPPMGGFGLDVTAKARELWDPEFARVLDRLERALRRAPAPHPVPCAALRSHLQWLGEHGTAEVRRACRGVLSALPTGIRHGLARALRGGPADPPGDAGAALDLPARQAALRDLFTAVIASLETLADADVAGESEECLRDLQQLLGDSATRARPFLYELVTARPSLAAAIADRAAADPDGILAGQLDIALTALAATGNPDAVTVARTLLAAGDTMIARHVARAFGLQRGRADQLLPGEDDLLRALAAHDDPAVHAMALTATRTLGQQHMQLAAELLLTAPPERPGFAWWEIALAAGPAGQDRGTPAWADLPGQYKNRFLTALRGVPSIDGPEASEFFEMLSIKEPEAMLALLTGRIEHAEDDAPPGYEPLPDHWQGTLRFRESGSFLDIARAACEWLAKGPRSLRQGYGSRLFSLVTGTFDDAARQVISSFLQEPDPARITAAASILRSVPAPEVWNLGFVQHCLRAASQCGTASLDEVQNALYRAVISGGQWSIFARPPSVITDAGTPAQLASQCASGSPEERFYTALAASAQEWASRQVALDLPADGRQW